MTDRNAETTVTVQPRKVAPTYCGKLSIRRPKEIGCDLEFLDGRLHGQQVFYDKEGWRLCTIDYRQGVADGAYRIWRDADRLRFEGCFVQGKPDGELRFYNDKGGVHHVGRFAGGEFDGEQVVYRSDGDPAFVANYDIGCRHGRFMSKYKDKVSFDLIFENGAPATNDFDLSQLKAVESKLESYRAFPYHKPRRVLDIADICCSKVLLDDAVLEELKVVWQGVDDSERSIASLADRPPSVLRDVIVWLLERRSGKRIERELGCANGYHWPTVQLMGTLLKRDITWQESDLMLLLSAAGGLGEDFYSNTDVADIHPIKADLMEPLLRLAKRGMLPDAIRSELVAMARWLSSAREEMEDRQLVAEIRRTTGFLDAALLYPDHWGMAINKHFATADSASRHAWFEFLDYAANASSSKPSAKWVKGAERLATKCGEDTSRLLFSWLRLLLPSGNEDIRWMERPNEVVAKGFVWFLAHQGVSEAGELFRMLAELCFTKIPYHGPRSTNVGNACLYGLSVLPDAEATAHLNELVQRLKYPQAKRMAERQLAATAARVGLTLEDLQDAATMDYGLSSDSALTVSIDGATGELRLTAPGAIEVSWHSADGRVLKGAPKPKTTLGDEALKLFKKLQADIKKSLAAQRRRLEGHYFQNRDMPFEFWWTNLMRKPLLRPMCSALIWTLSANGSRVNVMAQGDSLFDVDGNAVAIDAAATTVKLWHPLHDPASHAESWRERLFKLNVTQPFRQAYREIYSLPSKGEPDPFMKCFAGVWVRQHQFAALLKERDWSYSLMGGFDNWNAPSRIIPGTDIRAEIVPESESVESSVRGIALAISLERLCFERDDGEVPHQEIDPIVYSEILRDVDLFVARSAIGSAADWESLADEWGELQEEERARVLAELSAGDKLQQLLSDFGGIIGFNSAAEQRKNSLIQLISALSATMIERPLPQSAKIRAAILDRLLPHYKLDKCCHIDGQFLFVTGETCDYRIHLGSGACFDDANRFVVPGNVKRPPLESAGEADLLISRIIGQAIALAAKS